MRSFDSPPADDEHFEDPFEGFERSFMERYPRLWLATLIGPFIVTALVAGIFWMVAGPDEARRMLIMAAASLWLFGRFVILGGSDPDVVAVTGDITSLELFAMVQYLDVMVALLLAFHIGFLFRLPFIGKRLRAVITDGRFMLNEHPWIRRATFLGLTVFVAFPLTATGSVGGSIFGRLLGLSRGATFLGIFIGSLVGNGAMLLASDLIGEHINKDHPAVKYGGLVLIAALVLFLNSRYERSKKRFDHQHRAQARNGS